MSEKGNVVIEPATEADLDELSEMLGELFAQESDFRPDKEKQLRGLRLIFEQPSRGRVFVLRRDGAIVGMINLLFTISTAEGGFVILLEDLVIHKEHQGHGYGSKLLQHAIDFAKQKNFLRITLLTDRPENAGGREPVARWLCLPLQFFLARRYPRLSPQFLIIDPGTQLTRETCLKFRPELNFIDRLCDFRRTCRRQISLCISF